MWDKSNARFRMVWFWSMKPKWLSDESLLNVPISTDWWSQLQLDYWRLYASLGLNELNEGNGWISIRHRAVYISYSDVTWVSWHLKSQATRLLVQQHIKLRIKKNIKAPYTSALTSWRHRINAMSAVVLMSWYIGNQWSSIYADLSGTFIKNDMSEDPSRLYRKYCDSCTDGSIFRDGKAGNRLFRLPCAQKTRM